MDLFPSLSEAYTKEHLSARQAQRLAEFIAWAPVVFQASRVMVDQGILELLRDHKDGMTVKEVSQNCNLSEYAVKVLLEASLSIGTVLVDAQTDKFTLSKTGWFLINDPATRVNMAFNHDVNYEGFFHLEESLKEGRPAGLTHFGSWSTLYEGLSSLPEQVQKSWFGFDHFYSDNSFEDALKIVFSFAPKQIMDVGGNTGRWAEKCVKYNEDVKVTIVDLPQQLELMKKAVAGKPGAERISACPMNLLDDSAKFPEDCRPDVIWMSQFLDCFSEPQILSILKRAASVMRPESHLCIMETFWNRQAFEPASFCLTMTSLYFTAMANGNSKMYHSDDMLALVEQAGMVVEKIVDGLGQGHSIMICKLK